MMIAMAPPAASTSQGLRRPAWAATTEGRPKTPLPMIELTMSAARVQRPMARTRSGRLSRMGEFVSQEGVARAPSPALCFILRAFPSMLLRAATVREAPLQSGAAFRDVLVVVSGGGLSLGARARAPA